MGTWLGNARGRDNGLLIPGGPGHRRNADLLIGEQCLVVTLRSASTDLSWDDKASPTSSRRDGMSWNLTGWGSSLQAVGMSGGPELDAIRAERKLLLQRLVSERSGPRTTFDHAAIPLWAPQLNRPGMAHQFEIASALLQLLHDRPDLRAKLSDRGCVDTLAGDLTSKLGPGPSQATMSATSGVLHHLIATLGYDFTYGRPLPNDARESLDVVLDKVMRAVASNSWNRGHITAEQATAAIKKQYLDVAPWPFAALGV